MDVISIRLEKPLSKKIDQSMSEFDYSTKTEFIRDAIRTKLALLKEEKLKQKHWEKLLSLKGSVKPKTDDPDHFLKWREAEGDKLFKEYYSKKFNIKLD